MTRSDTDTDPAALTERISSAQQELDSAWIDGPPVPSGTIVASDCDPQWPVLYAREEARIRELLGDTVVCVAHVGSTSVPGLVAKPVIDNRPGRALFRGREFPWAQLEWAEYRLIFRD